MDDILDFIKASILILLAISIITAAFYAFTIVIPVLLVAALVYFIAKVMKDERERY